MDSAQKIQHGIRECVGMYRHVEDGRWGALFFDWKNCTWILQMSNCEVRYDVVVNPEKVVPLPH
jgi:hypothetical protein